MKLSRFAELVNELVADTPADAEVEVFLAKDGHSVDLRHLELTDMCQVPETIRWQRCEVADCTNTKQLGILLS